MCRYVSADVFVASAAGKNAFMHVTTNIAVISVDDDLDARVAKRIRAAVEGVVGRGCRRVVLNLDGACRIDRDGVAMLLGEIRSLRSRGGLLSLVNVHERAYRTLQNTRIVDVVPVSIAGPRPSVPSLPQGVEPVWRRAFKVDPLRMGESRSRVEELAREMGFADEDVFDLVLAVGEAIGNAVDHAEGDVIVTISAYVDRAIVEVTDRGCGFEARDDELLEAELSAERGRGIALMRMLVDAVSVCRRPSGVGTCVRIVKLLDNGRAV